MNPSDPNLERIIADAAAREIAPASQTETQPDLSIDLSEYRISFQIECLHSELRHMNQNHELRLAYTGRIFWLVVGWLICVVACIGMSGFAVNGFGLPDSVLIAFITSTTVNVIGLFVLVAKWMYPSQAMADPKSLHAKAAKIADRNSDISK